VEHVGNGGVEREEVMGKPVERGWGIWYKADMIAAEVEAQQTTLGPGVVIGANESLRVLEFLDEARRSASIIYNNTVEEV